MTSTLDAGRSDMPVRAARDLGRGDVDARPDDSVAEGAGGSRKKKMTISLSEKSVRAFDELKRLTDADTDSEVFRNALRLHLMLLRAHQSGVRLYMKRDGGEEVVPVGLFVEDPAGA